MKAILFDLDGVIFDTERQYSRFWGGEFRRYYPERPGLEAEIKGQTLNEIFSTWFSGSLTPERPAITERLNRFESRMEFPYVTGFQDFLQEIHTHGIRTAVVTSSNEAKMLSVYRAHPDFAGQFDRIVTADDIRHSKPAPDGYLKAAELLGVTPMDCVVFEDSINGLRAGRNAQMRVVGLATSLPLPLISPLCDLPITNYHAIPPQFFD